MKRFLLLLFFSLGLSVLPGNSAFAQCGGERWPVKIGTDSNANQVNLNSATPTTIASLTGIAIPKKLQDNNRVAPTETTVYVVNATLKKYVRMYDLDYHMVIADSAGRTMIAEIPSPTCVGNSRFAAGVARARAQFDAMFTPTTTFQNVSIPIQITGVGFFDHLEGQVGQAPNGIELHAVLDIVFDSNFALAAAPTSLSVAQGASASSTITSTLSGPFNSAISFTAAGLPTGTTASFSPSSIPTPGSGTTVLTIGSGASTPPGSYNVVVTGTGGGQTHSVTITLTVTSGDNSAQQLLGNTGFENGSANPAPWSATSGVIDNSSSRASHTGAWKAWLNGYGSAHTDTLQQTVSIPANVTNAALSFWLHIDTAETTATAANDTLKIQIRNSSGTVLTTLATYSNLNVIANYAQVSFDVTAFKGQTVQVYLVGTENASLKSSFIVDDFSLNTNTSSAGDFGISADPAAIAMTQGSSASSAITTTTSGSFNSIVALSVNGLPSGATASFSPPAIAAPGNGSSNLTIFTGSATAVGTYNIAVTGTGGGQTHSTPIVLTVTGSGSGTTQQLLGNPGFENGSSNPAPWTASSSDIIDNKSSRASHSGAWKAWLNGYGSTHTNTILQTVSIPSGAINATLAFWLHIDTAETSSTRAYDTLQVQLRNSSGTVLATLASYSNLDAATAFAPVSFDITSYKGQTIQVYLIGVEDSSLQTSFVVDDFTLNVTTP